jgi:hypothetical protein
MCATVAELSCGSAFSPFVPQWQAGMLLARFYGSQDAAELHLLRYHRLCAQQVALPVIACEISASYWKAHPVTATAL